MYLCDPSPSITFTQCSVFVNYMYMYISLQVLQHSVDQDLHLYKDMKNQKEYIACVKMVSLSSQPVNHEYSQNGHRKLVSSDAGK